MFLSKLSSFKRLVSFTCPHQNTMHLSSPQIAARPYSLTFLNSVPIMISNILYSSSTSSLVRHNISSLHCPQKPAGSVTSTNVKFWSAHTSVTSLPRQAIFLRSLCCQLCAPSVLWLNHIPFFNTSQRKWSPHFREGMCAPLLRTSRKKNELPTPNSNSTERPRMEPTKGRRLFWDSSRLRPGRHRLLEGSRLPPS